VKGGHSLRSARRECQKTKKKNKKRPKNTKKRGGGKMQLKGSGPLGRLFVSSVEGRRQFVKGSNSQEEQKQGRCDRRMFPRGNQSRAEMRTPKRGMFTGSTLTGHVRLVFWKALVRNRITCRGSEVIGKKG